MIELLNEVMGDGGGLFVLAAVLGLAFGFIGEQSGFCLRAAVEEWITPQKPTELFREGSRTAQYISAIAVGIITVYFAEQLGWIDLSSSVHRTAQFTYLGMIVGGLLFGAGMVLAGGCISRLTILAARGNLRSWWVIIVLSITAWATLGGILSPLRLLLERVSTGGTLPNVSSPVGLIAALLILAAALAISLKFKPARPRDFLFGAIVGLLVLAGWLITSIAAQDPFAEVQVVSLTFTRPSVDTLQAVTIWTGIDWTFGFGLMLGTLGGAFLSALLSGRLFIDGFRNESDPLRYGLGGILMGFGGILGLGCSLGQGLTGMSTLSVGALMVLASIVIGAAITFRLRARA